MTVWITRSAPHNLRTARSVRDLGQRPLLVPVLSTIAAEPATPGPHPDGIVFTSLHAVHHFTACPLLLSTRVFAASGVIAEAAMAKGYREVTSIDEAALPALMNHTLPTASRIWIIGGERTSQALSDALRSAGHHVDHHAVFRTIGEQAHSLNDLMRALRSVNAVTVHSCSGAEHIARILASAHWRGAIWCISDQSSRPFAGIPGLRVHVAPMPTETALIDMIGHLTRSSRRPPSRSRIANAVMMFRRLGRRQSPPRDPALNDNLIETSL